MLPASRLVAGLLLMAAALGARAQGAQAAFPGVPQVASAPVTYQPPLPFPIEAQKRRREGAVVVAFLVGTDGAPERFRILESDPPLIFDDAVRSAAPEFRFAPAVMDGKPARYETRITLTFRPQQGGPGR